MKSSLSAASLLGLFAGLLFTAAICSDAQAQDFKVTPTIVESHGREDAATVQALTVAVRLSNNLMVSTGTPFTVRFEDPAGNPVGKPLKIRTNDPPTPGDGNKLKIEVPKAAQPVGSKMIISPDDLDSATVTLKITQGTGSIQKAAVMVVPGPPVEPAGPPKRWDFELPGPDPLDPMMLDYGGRVAAVVSGGFDLQLVASIGSSFDVFVVGRQSHLTLADDSYLFFAEAELLGSIEVVAGALSGQFNFSGIGLSGFWTLDPLSNSTRLVATSSSAFGAAALQTVPEPSTLGLLPLALLLAWVPARRWWSAANVCGGRSATPGFNASSHQSR